MPFWLVMRKKKRRNFVDTTDAQQKIQAKHSRRTETTTMIKGQFRITPADEQWECILHEDKECTMCVPARLQDFGSFVKALGVTHRFK